MSEKLSDEQKRQIDETAQTFTSKMTDFFWHNRKRRDKRWVV